MGGEVALNFIKCFNQKSHEPHIKSIDPIGGPSFINVIEKENQLCSGSCVFFDQIANFRDVVFVENVRKSFCR